MNKLNITSAACRRQIMDRAIIRTIAITLAVLTPCWAQGFINQLHPSTTDAWDTSNGTLVTASSGLQTDSDPRDGFGAGFSSNDPGSIFFSDGKPSGFIHYIEWQTAAPVTLQSLRVFSQGDGAANNNAREFASFV